MPKKYRIDVSIPIEIENPKLYETEDKAYDAMVDLAMMQPENRYEIVEVEIP